jgi:16S rRNA (guanine966-N2)-methyltransferase
MRERARNPASARRVAWDAMTRIISGAAGSLRLRVPGSGTRPTSDRVREGIFSSLEARDALEGARVLDLYAGSGALGLEAISRGASTLVLVDKAPAAAAACRANAALVAKAAEIAPAALRVVPASVPTFLAGDSGVYDLVFLDPPYSLPPAELVLALERLVPRLDEDATVVLERSSRLPGPPLPDGLVEERARTYGDTVVALLGRA